ncbi:BtrH N-terminal domain-containing protein [Clostridium bornimense]|uniref:BtrH N-terminal domain-containing protein n=1 Tax=Clostridium bornimense TaxID=1216932 RepID=UPI001C114B39|nr:BtrH N-terminal domain-containing protein [Clostridium bornimense]MBU5317320.1 BtrH N-terminal domain-containing protein [Clostridium bornimense]
MNKICYDIKPFTDVWVKDCYHMSMLPGIIYTIGNADCVLFNQYFKYALYEDSIVFQNYDYKNVYEILKSNNVKVLPIEKVKNIHRFISEKLQSGNVIIIGIDNYYENIRRDFYKKKHSGHSILIIGVDYLNKRYKIIEQPFFYSINYQYYEIEFEYLEKSYKSFLKNKDDNYFFYNKLTDTTRINGAIPSICTIDVKALKRQALNEVIRKHYKEELASKQQEIIDSLCMIQKFRDNFERIYEECKNESRYSLDIIKNLNGTINNKILEIYLLKLVEPIEDEMDKISKNVISRWSEIRTILSKYMFSNEYNAKHMENGLCILQQIYNEESYFYNNIC